MQIREIPLNEFENRWRPIQDRIFGGASPESGFFKDGSWSVVLLPGGLVIDDDLFEALAETACPGQQGTFAVAGYREEFQAQPAFVMDWDRAGLKSVAIESVLGHLDAVSFDQSGTWGRFCSPETFSVLGGKERFMNDFRQRAGGENNLQERFRESARLGEIGYGDQGRQFIDALLAMAGWR